MKLTPKQQEALNWLKEIKQKEKLDITLRWIDDYWRVCPVTIDKDRIKGTVHVGKINMRTWQALIDKGYFKKELSNTNHDGYIYIYN